MEVWKLKANLTEEISRGISDQQSVRTNQSWGVNFGRYNVLDIKGNIIGTLNGFTYEEVIKLIAELRSQEQTKIYSGRQPYLGLMTYQESDTDLFFGRDKLVEELTSRLAGERFLCLSGPSGSGKSSLIRAGVIPALRRGQHVPGSDKWLIESLTPGDQPIESLALTMSAMALQAGKSFKTSGDFIRKHGKNDASALATLIELLTLDGDGRKAVILVDQFEEVFAENRDKIGQDAFIAQLIYAAQAQEGKLIVILTLRSDFLYYVTGFPGLRKLINQGIQLIGAMDSAELARAITLPAIQEGVQVDPALVEKVIFDMLGEPGALPLMQFTLKDLFERENPRQGEPVQLTLEAYLQSGGVWEALSRHADAALGKLRPDDQKTARQIFVRLVEMGGNQVDTRRTASTAELLSIGIDPATLKRVLQVMTEARLIVAQDGQSESVEDTRSLSLAHDRLINDWPWLKELAREKREEIALISQIESDAKLWEKNKGEVSYLYSGEKLIAAQDRLVEINLALNPLGHNFMEQSMGRDQAYQRQIKVNRLRDSAIRGLIGGAIGFSLVFVLVFWPQVEGVDPLTLIFGAIFMASSGALSGLVLALSVQALHSWSDRIAWFSSLLLSGLAGAIAFSIPLLVYYLLFATPFEIGQSMLILLESSLWGFVAGLGVFVSVGISRPFWQTLPIVGFTSGLILVLGEMIAAGFAIPDRTQGVGEATTSPELLPGLIFVVGALVPLCIAGAMRYGRDVSNDFD